MKNTSPQKVSKKRLRMALMCLVFFVQVAPCWIMMGCAKNYNRTEQEQHAKKNAKLVSEHSETEKGEKVATEAPTEAAPAPGTEDIATEAPTEAARTPEATQAPASSPTVETVVEEETEPAAPASSSATGAVEEKKEPTDTTLQAVTRGFLAIKKVKEAAHCAEEERQKQRRKVEVNAYGVSQIRDSSTPQENGSKQGATTTQKEETEAPKALEAARTPEATQAPASSSATGAAANTADTTTTAVQLQESSEQQNDDQTTEAQESTAVVTTTEAQESTAVVTTTEAPTEAAPATEAARTPEATQAPASSSATGAAATQKEGETEAPKALEGRENTPQKEEAPREEVGRDSDTGHPNDFIELTHNPPTTDHQTLIPHAMGRDYYLKGAAQPLGCPAKLLLVVGTGVVIQKYFVKQKKAARRPIARNKAKEEAKKKEEEARRQEEAKKEAATKIQTFVRKHNAEKQLAAEKKAATKIQAAVRERQAKKRAAATKIQAAIRRYNAEKQLAAAKKAATKIQAAVRERQAKKRAAATKIQAAVRKHNAEKQFAIAKKAATTIQAVTRGLIARENFVKQKEAAKRAAEQVAAKKIQAAARRCDTANNTLNNGAAEQKAINKAKKPYRKQEGAQSHREPKKPSFLGGLSKKSEIVLKNSEEENTDVDAKEHSTTEADDDSFEDVGDWSNHENGQNSVATGVSATTIIKPKERLNSSTLRQVIIKQLLYFKESEHTFAAGGVTKPTFFYKADSHSGENTYIALAHNRPPEGFKKNNHEEKREIIECGEQSISIVLQAIKKDLEGNNKNSETKILIPLQQIGKKHWTLLAITLTRCAASENNAYTAEAIHYDSKGLQNKLRDKVSEGKPYVDAQVKQYFPAKEVAYQYLRTQGLFDHHNCGRYTLIKLLALIDPEEDPRTIRDINDMINAESKTIEKN